MDQTCQFVQEEDKEDEKIYKAPILGPNPVNLHCPNCGHKITTQTISTITKGAYAASFFISAVGLCCGCCLLPFFSSEFRNVQHFCPVCHALIGVRDGECRVVEYFRKSGEKKEEPQKDKLSQEDKKNKVPEDKGKKDGREERKTVSQEDNKIKPEKRRSKFGLSEKTTGERKSSVNPEDKSIPEEKKIRFSLAEPVDRKPSTTDKRSDGAVERKSSISQEDRKASEETRTLLALAK